ncbi:MAG: ADOP family duplicated permease [Terriglobales bacterium]
MWQAGEAAGQELMRAARRLLRRRTTAALVVVILGLAMGVSTAMFSVFDTLVLHPLPFPGAQRLVWLQTTNLRTGAVLPSGFSVPDYQDLRAQAHLLRHVAGYYSQTATLIGRGAPVHLRYSNVTGEFFPALGVKPLLGLMLERGGEARRKGIAAEISYGLWRQYFGGDPEVTRRQLDLDSELVAIAGVMPKGFAYPAGIDVWIYSPGSSVQRRDWRYLSVFARLTPGATLRGAQQQASAVAARLAQAYPTDDNNIGIRISPMGAQVAGAAAGTMDLMMIGALLVLLLACANAGNLLLGAAVARWPEIALQMALGASRKRLWGQLLAEGVILAALAGAVGWGLAAAGMPVIRHLQAPSLPALAQVQLNGRVLGFGMLVALAVALWFAVAPGWELLRAGSGVQPARSLGRQPRRTPLAPVLMVAEVAVTVMLLLGAGLFWQSLRRLEAISPGFDPHNVLTFRTALLFTSDAELKAKEGYFEKLNEALQHLPGVTAAGMVSQLPYVRTTAYPSVAAAGSAAAQAPGNQSPQAGLLAVLPDYFQAMGMPVRGRSFSARDGQAGADPVVIISDGVAQALFPHGGALGRSLVMFWGRRQTLRIVGITAPVGASRPGDPSARNLFVPLETSIRNSMSAVVRVRAKDPMALLPAIRRASAALDPQVALWNVATLEQRLDAANAPPRYRANLLGVLGLLALALAGAGLYGVLAHNVAQQRREIGVRMALGASTQQVAAEVMRASLRLIGAGITAGLLLAWWLRGSVEHLLYGSVGGAGWMWVGVPVVVVVVGLVATLAPARRAARVDPVIALRE